MKKILLLIDSLGSGGAQRQIVGLAGLLNDRGYDVVIGDYWDIDFYDKYLEERCIRYEHCVAKGKWNIFKKIWRLIRRERPDVVISYLEHSSAIASLIKISHTTKRFRLIVSERNTTQEITPAVKFRFALFKVASAIVPNSYSQKDFIDTHYPHLSSKTFTITNFLDTDKFSPEREKKPISKSRRFVIVGRVVEQKNPINFIRAVKEVRLSHPDLDFTVDWYGHPHPQSYFDECLRLRDELGLNDTIHFHAPTNDIVSIYRESDIFILPSIYEGFPNVLCEAMSCGLPVAASNVCDNPSILDDGKIGPLFDPNSVKDMASVLERMLMMSDNELEGMAKRSREAALHKFSADKFIESYIKLIEE